MQNNNLRVLKNTTYSPIITNSYGKRFIILPKGSLTIKDNQADKIAKELLYRYEFLKDITPKPTITIEIKAVYELTPKGRKVLKKKKVVKKAKGGVK